MKTKEMLGDDGTRSGSGIMVSTKDVGDRVRLVVDRIEVNHRGEVRLWPVTFKDFSRETFEQTAMSDEDLANLGLIILTDLAGQFSARRQ